MQIAEGSGNILVAQAVINSQNFDVPETTASLILDRAETMFLEAWVPSKSGEDKEQIAWLVTAVSKPVRSTALKASIRALSITRLGRMMNDKNLVMLGKDAYSIALQEVQKALWCEEKMYDDDTVAAGKLCAEHEVMIRV